MSDITRGILRELKKLKRELEEFSDKAEELEERVMELEKGPPAVPPKKEKSDDD